MITFVSKLPYLFINCYVWNKFNSVLLLSVLINKKIKIKINQTIHVVK
jgi:hypothetical protein